MKDLTFWGKRLCILYGLCLCCGYSVGCMTPAGSFGGETLVKVGLAQKKYKSEKVVGYEDANGNPITAEKAVELRANGQDVYEVLEVQGDYEPSDTAKDASSGFPFGEVALGLVSFIAVKMGWTGFSESRKRKMA